MGNSCDFRREGETPEVPDIERGRARYPAQEKVLRPWGRGKPYYLTIF